MVDLVWSGQGHAYATDELSQSTGGIPVAARQEARGGSRFRSLFEIERVVLDFRDLLRVKPRTSVRIPLRITFGADPVSPEHKGRILSLLQDEGRTKPIRER